MNAFGRRSLLKAALALVPGLVGLPVLSRWLPGLVADAATVGRAAGTVADAAATSAPAPSWAFVCDTTKCIGCGLCVQACKLENHVPADPEANRTWVERHIVATDGEVFVDSPDGGSHGFPSRSTVPGAADHQVRQAFFEPRLCMQCENAPCLRVCPVGATYRTKEGVILVDQARCIGCGYCVVACPYGARYIVPSGGETPMGVAGVADKCTWCYQRTSRGDEPACVEVCPVGARVFGDLDDPASEVTRILDGQRTTVLKPALGTRPRVYYVGLEAEVDA